MERTLAMLSHVNSELFSEREEAARTSPNTLSSGLSPAVRSTNDRVGDLSSELPSKRRKVSECHVNS